MTNTPDEQPIEGEVFGPGENLPVPNQPTDGKGKRRAKPGRKPKDEGAKPPGKKHPTMGKGFGKQRTEEEVEAEEAASKAWHALVACGGFDWRYANWEPTPQQRDTVGMLKFAGYNDEDIAYAIGMTVETLQRYFEFELRTGRMLVIGDLAQRAVHRARNGNDVLLMFLLKTRSGGNFSERVAAVEKLAGDSAGGEAALTDARRREIVDTLASLFTDKRINKKKDEAK